MAMPDLQGPLSLGQAEKQKRGRERIVCPLCQGRFNGPFDPRGSLVAIDIEDKVEIKNYRLRRRNPG